MTEAQRAITDRLTAAATRLHTDADALLRVVESVAERIPAGAHAPPSSLTVAEERALRSAGSLQYELPPLSDRASTRTAGRYAELLGSACSVAEAARLINVSEGRVRQRLGKRELFGLRIGEAWRLPRFQFSGGGVVPGLDRVFPHLPAGLHPLAVYGFLTRPSVDLVVDGEPVSPLDWLLSGGMPEPVAALAVDLGRLP